MYISKWFTKEEVTCKCGCGFNAMAAGTLQVADALRDWYGKPIIPTSGCRCVIYNKKVGGAKGSYHLPHTYKVGAEVKFQSMAMDLPLDDPKAAAKWLEENYPKVSYLVYPTFIHIDIRKRKYTRYL